MTIIILTALVLPVILILPLSFKWELNLKLVIPYTALLTISVLTLTTIFNGLFTPSFEYIVLFEILLIIVVSVIVFLWRFYRDPERKSVYSDKLILAPADGKIIYINQLDNNAVPVSVKNTNSYSLNDLTHTDLLSGGVYHIGIMMSFLDVHVNRAPISGTIEYIKHIKGRFSSLKIIDSIFENERTIIVIKGKTLRLGIVQIASRLVRMIVPFVKYGDMINCGDRIGKIRFGSQVDLIIPNIPGLIIQIKENEYVKAGITPVAQIN